MGKAVYKALVVVHAFVKKKKRNIKTKKKKKLQDVDRSGYIREVNSMKSPMEYLEKKYDHFAKLTLFFFFVKYRKFNVCS